MPNRDNTLAHESLLHTHVPMRTSTDEHSPPPPSTSPRRKSSRRKSKRLSRDANVKDPFYTAASCPEGTHPALYFEAKYYGPCPDIPADSTCPAEVNVIQLLKSKKESGLQIKCHLYFNEKGISVINREKQPTPIAIWKTMNVASCATIKHPNRGGRRIGFLKVRNADNTRLEWHLFKYCVGKKDNLSDCFRYVVDCSLRDIGRAVANRAQMDMQRRASLTAGMPTGTAAAWDEPDVQPPPRYEAHQRTRRSLQFDQFAEGDAKEEAADIERGVQRLSVSHPHEVDSDDDGEETGTYMYLE